MQFELSNLTIKLILLFLPGIISFLLIKILTNHKVYKIFYVLIYSFLLGFLNYFIYYLFILLLKRFNLLQHPSLSKTVVFFDFINGIVNEINFLEIILVVGISIPVGFLFVYFINNNILNKFARLIRSTEKYSEVDVWSHIMNSKNVPEWVYISDIKNNLIYYGWVLIYSDITEHDELFLTNVKVYRYTDSKFLYDRAGLYLNNSRKELIIQFPIININKEKKKRWWNKKSKK